MNNTSQLLEKWINNEQHESIIGHEWMNNEHESIIGDGWMNNEQH